MLEERELHLPPQWQVTADGWYPVETFERMAIAWLHLVAAGRPETFTQLGEKSVDVLLQRNPELFCAGDVRETVMRCLVMRKSQFDFTAFEVRGISDTDVQLELKHGMAPLAEHAAACQTVGFLTRLLELCGATDVVTAFTARSWEGDPHTTVEMSWQLR